MNSVLFGRPDGPRQTVGIGSSLVAPQLDHSGFDGLHWMSDALMFALARRAGREFGLFIGPTGAAALEAARWHAAREPDQLFAAVLPDQGHRYLISAFRRGRLAPAASAPVELSLAEALAAAAPQEGGADWIVAPWDRRTFLQHR